MKKIIVIAVSVIAVFLIVCWIACDSNEIKADELTSEVVENETEKKEEEVNEGEVAPPTEEEIEEDVKFVNLLNDFKDKWIQPIVTAFSGVLGCLFTILVAHKKIKKLELLAKAQQDTNSENVEETRKELEKAKEELEVAKTDFETAMNETKPLVEEIIKNNNQSELFKELIAILISANEDFMKDGTAQKILDLLDDKE